MQIVTFPKHLIASFLEEARQLLENGAVAEGKYVRESSEMYVIGKRSIPVSSGGAALLALLAYRKHTEGRQVAIIQSNTMRALYTVPTLLGMKTLIAECTFDDYLSMNPLSLRKLLSNEELRKNSVVVYSVIGGFLAPSFLEIAKICSEARVPLIVDGAHGHYLDTLTNRSDVDTAYSFYATKILPAGEGGLVCTSNQEAYEWIRRFVIYDRFSNELPVGLNIRASEISAALIFRMMTDPELKSHFVDARVNIAREYQAVCENHNIQFLRPDGALDYNGYKFVVLDPLKQVQALNTELTSHTQTSGVFDTNVLGEPTALYHWCPPTYSSLRKAP